jgi:hypothetical protein
MALSVTSAAADQHSAPKEEAGEIIFVPPATGAPADRLGAGTRDVGRDAVIQLLAPDAGGLSATPQPLLLWHLAQPAPGPITLTITPSRGLARGVVLRLDGPFTIGFHSVDLARTRFLLAPGQLYRWQVSVDDTASAEPALIEHRPPAVMPGTPAEAAAAGYWHDALAGVFTVDGAGRATLRNEAALRSLSRGAGFDLTKIADAQQ